MTTSIPTSRTKVKRVPQRGLYEKKDIYPILDEALVCQVGFLWDGYVTVIPTIHWRIGDHLYIHGSTASRMMEVLASGKEACITVTLVDGLVLARSVFHHSMNYRSVVVFGSGKVIESPEEKEKAMEEFVERIIPGRWSEARLPKPQEIKATTIIAFDLKEASAKIRTGDPVDDEEDYDLPVWAGVIPLQTEVKAPIADPRLSSKISLPEYVKTWSPRRERL